MNIQEVIQRINSAKSKELADRIINDGEPMEVVSAWDPKDEIFYMPIPNFLNH